MGGKELTPTPLNILAYLDELCAYALFLGMTLDQYWHDDPKIMNYYIKAQEIRMKQENQKLWLQGAYIYNALGSVAPLFNGLSKSNKARPYIKQPFALTQEEEEERKYQAFKQYMFDLAKKK